MLSLSKHTQVHCAHFHISLNQWWTLCSTTLKKIQYQWGVCLSQIWRFDSSNLEPKWEQYKQLHTAGPETLHTRGRTGFPQQQRRHLARLECKHINTNAHANTFMWVSLIRCIYLIMWPGRSCGIGEIFVNVKVLFQTVCCHVYFYSLCHYTCSVITIEIWLFPLYTLSTLSTLRQTPR